MTYKDHYSSKSPKGSDRVSSDVAKSRSTPGATLPPAEEIAALRERVAVLERELGLAHNAEKAAVIRKRLGVTPAQSLLLYAMARAYPRAAQTWALDENLPRIERVSGFAVIKAHVWKLRQQFGQDSIITGEGSYRMAPALYTRVRICTELPVERAA